MLGFRTPFGRRNTPPPNAVSAGEPLSFPPLSTEDLLMRAEAGNVDAMARLGERYHKGDGVAQDYGRAAEWMLKAEAGGDQLSSFVLAHMYAQGQGVPQNGPEALRRFRQMAATNSFATYSIGLMYFKGSGIEQNAVLAYVHFRIAALFGNKAAIDSLVVTSAYLSPEQLEEGDQLFNAWAPGRPFPESARSDPRLAEPTPEHQAHFFGPLLNAVRELSPGDLSVLEAASNQPDSTIMTVARSRLAVFATLLERLGWMLPQPAPEGPAALNGAARLYLVTPKGRESLLLLFRILLQQRRA
jgi:Sel1 repeat